MAPKRERSWCICAVVMAGAFATPGVAQTTHTVNLSGMSFSPAHSTINVGDTVRWVWLAGIHDVESGTSGANIGDGKFSAGDPVFAPNTFEVVFDQGFVDANPIPGDVYPYYCSVHFSMGMTGTITVQTGGGCTGDGDCDDGNPCTDDSCSGGNCQHTNNSNSCNDSDTCTTGDRCSEGGCSGAPINCDDGNPCTDDSCSGGNCRHTNNSNPCNDSDTCTTGDRCSDGGCSGTPINCDDGNPCTDDSCSGGNCRHTNNSSSCNDGDTCTTDACINGACVGTSIPGCTSCAQDDECDDTDPCTDDACGGGVCTHVNNSALCDDGDPCTEDDACNSGVCTGKAVEGCCRDDGACDDGDPCTTGRCLNNECVHVTKAECDDSGAGEPGLDVPDDSDAGTGDDGEGGASRPADESPGRPNAGARGPCGVFGIFQFAGIMLGLGVMRRVHSRRRSGLSALAERRR